MQIRFSKGDRFPGDTDAQEWETLEESAGRVVHQAQQGAGPSGQGELVPILRQTGDDPGGS